jgi:hypothetical protein
MYSKIEENRGAEYETDRKGDDLGWTDGVNAGIEKAARDGILTAAGCMPNMEEPVPDIRHSEFLSETAEPVPAMKTCS